MTMYQYCILIHGHHAITTQYYYTPEIKKILLSCDTTRQPCSHPYRFSSFTIDGKVCHLFRSKSRAINRASI